MQRLRHLGTPGLLPALRIAAACGGGGGRAGGGRAGGGRGGGGRGGGDALCAMHRRVARSRAGGPEAATLCMPACSPGVPGGSPACPGCTPVCHAMPRSGGVELLVRVWAQRGRHGSRFRGSLGAHVRVPQPHGVEPASLRGRGCSPIGWRLRPSAAERQPMRPGATAAVAGHTPSALQTSEGVSNL